MVFRGAPGFRMQIPSQYKIIIIIIIIYIADSSGLTKAWI
jgi:hypothetical protein